eukprot:TRINITY_DN26888_c0_g1_i1.p1 TRINITY_DN26888_c0_g1~~TRINITY_DN26888_c0_g1_i1.p1  ORF type:complete len:102 (-),score=5.05 TRINITY_DN26888_c0_g1_i1:26-331(-)
MSTIRTAFTSLVKRVGGSSMTSSVYSVTQQATQRAVPVRTIYWTPKKIKNVQRQRQMQRDAAARRERRMSVVRNRRPQSKYLPEIRAEIDAWNAKIASGSA